MRCWPHASRASWCRSKLTFGWGLLRTVRPGAAAEVHSCMSCMAVPAWHVVAEPPLPHMLQAPAPACTLTSTTTCEGRPSEGLLITGCDMARPDMAECWLSDGSSLTQQCPCLALRSPKPRYVLLRGRKRFRLYPPQLASKMYTVGKVERVHPNGRIVFKGQVRGALGAALHRAQSGASAACAAGRFDGNRMPTVAPRLVLSSTVCQSL